MTRNCTIRIYVLLIPYRIFYFIKSLKATETVSAVNGLVLSYFKRTIM
jgi:hypothetical protein